MKKILLTRSENENQILSGEVSRLGFIPILTPMISYEKLPVDFIQFRDGLDIIITSKFAAKIIAENYHYNANCFVVGEESASILKLNPKLNIKYIAEAAEELVLILPSFSGLTREPINDKWVLGSVPEDDGNVLNDRIIYFSGNIITTDFESAKRHVIYNVEYPDSLDENTIQEIKKGIKYIFLYSKNCASNLILLLKRHNLLQNIKNSVVIAMSSGVASEYEGYVSTILFPAKPKASEILRLLVEYERENTDRKA